MQVLQILQEPSASGRGEERMNPDSDLKALERRMYASFINDGLLEIFFGVLFLCGLAGDLLPILGVSREWIIPVLCALPIAFLWLKKHVTRARIGRVAFRPERRPTRLKFIVLIILSQAAALAVLATVLTGRSTAAAALGWVGGVRQVLAGALFFVLPFSVMAVYLENPRLLIAVFFGFFEEAYRGPLTAPWASVLTFGLGGTLLACAGGFQLLRFLKRYPRQDPGEDHE
jgi:hypothetical protein